jgi:hypothetical protein
LVVPLTGRIVEGFAAGTEPYRRQVDQPGFQRYVQVDRVPLARFQVDVPHEVVTVDAGGVRLRIHHRLCAEPGIAVAERQSPSVCAVVADGLGRPVAPGPALDLEQVGEVGTDQHPQLGAERPGGERLQVDPLV